MASYGGTGFVNGIVTAVSRLAAVCSITLYSSTYFKLFLCIVIISATAKHKPPSISIISSQ